MSSVARPALRRIRWATGIPLDVEHFRAIDALIEGRIRWASVDAAGVLPPIADEKTFEVEGHVEHGALWVKVSALQAIARDGGLLCVSPERALHGEAKLDGIRSQSAVQVYLVPDGWKEGPPVIERSLDDGGRFEEPGCRLLFLQEDRDTRGVGLTGLKIGEFQLDRQGSWRWAAPFLPLVTTMNATAATNRAREEILRFARHLRDLLTTPRRAAEPIPEPHRPGPKDRWITNRAYYTQGATTTPMYSEDRKLASGGDGLSLPPPVAPPMAPLSAPPDAIHATLGALAARLVAGAVNPRVRPMDLHAEAAGFADACHGLLQGKGVETRGMDGSESDLTARFGDVVRALGALGDAITAWGR